MFIKLFGEGMISLTSKILHCLAFVILAFSFLACRLTVQTSNATSTSKPSESLAVESATATFQSAATPIYAAHLTTPTVATSLTPTLPLVTVTAINGNLYIRRGSGSDFNPISVLMQGQTVTASGRDILNEWLYIPIPSETGKFGWVSTLTIYSSISGNTMELPIVNSDLAVPAFMQNCSTDNMVVWPAGVIIPPFDQFPDNVVQFDPGEYLVQDYDKGNSSPNGTQGIAVDLKEGDQYQILGVGAARHKCPEGQ